MTELQHCPDAEILAAFIDQRGTEQERRMVTEHLSVCDDCLAVVGEATRFADSSEPETRGVEGGASIRRFPTPLLLAAAAMLIVVIGAAIVVMRRDAAPASYNRFVAATNEMTHRPYEGRLSGDFEWRPSEPVLRSGETAERSDPRWLRLQSAAGEVLADERTAEEQRARAELVAGDPERAVYALRSRADADRGNADLWSDLAVAELTLAHRSGDRGAALRAAAAAEQAIQIDGSNAAAWFNGALAAEQLGLIPQAREAFTRYLDLDPNSPWTEEARERLERLRVDAPPSP